jgi:hypothetical protein
MIKVCFELNEDQVIDELDSLFEELHTNCKD